MRWLALSVLLLTSTASAQVLMVKGGSDNIGSPIGAQAVLYDRFPLLGDTQSTFGAGITSGAIRWSAATLFDWRGNEINVGDSTLGSGGGAFPLRGVSILRKNRNQILDIFAGRAGDVVSPGFYAGLTPQHFGAGLFFSRTFFDDALQLQSSDSLDGNLKTALQQVTWMRKRYSLMASGGLEAGAKSLNFGGTFRPFDALQLSGMHGNLFLWVPQSDGTGKSERAEFNSAGVSSHLGLVGLRANYFSSRADGITHSGEDFGASLNLGRALVTADYLVPNRGGDLLDGTIDFHVSRHIEVDAFESFFQGQRSLNFGGGYSGNSFSLNLGWENLYYPLAAQSRSPFQNVFTMSLSFHLPHASSVNLSTVHLPTGRLQYSAWMSSWFEGNTGYAGAPARRPRVLVFSEL